MRCAPQLYHNCSGFLLKGTFSRMQESGTQAEQQTQLRRKRLELCAAEAAEVGGVAYLKIGSCERGAPQVYMEMQHGSLAKSWTEYRYDRTL